MDLSRVSKKTPLEDFRSTLSTIDDKTIEKFEKEKKNLDEKIRTLNALNKKKISSRNKHSNEYFELCKKINTLEKEINDISMDKNKNDYLMKAATHFLKYTEKIENPHVETVNSFFIIKENNRKGQIYENYIKECIGNGYSLSTKSNEIDLCKELTCVVCGIEKLTNTRESYASCPKCGEVSKYQDIQNNKGEYSEEVEVLSPFSYKRKNHFKEWISSLIGREGTTIITQEILDELLRELKKDKIERREDVTEKLIKGYLKKLKRSKLYEHTPAIIFKLCGIPPPQIPPQLEAKLIEMFEQIQLFFEKHITKCRKNFLSYSYCLHKMLQLLGENKLLDKLPLLKSREKLYFQDMMWKGICSETGWKFIRSL